MRALTVPLLASVASVVSIVTLASSSAQARPQYVSMFPNGTRIDGQGCQNCHNSPQGGDARNPFGLAMAGHSFSWSSVCNVDSDGDGQTNGQELGDPDCVWTQGSGARTTSISNPGRVTSISTDPLGGSADAALAVTRVCPDHSSSIVTGCLCDDGFGPSSDGSSCAAASGIGSTWMCDPSWIGDGSCDCGCGAPDSDCANTAAATCQFNDCDFWQPSSGLPVDTTDSTKCAGGLVSSSPGGAISGSCPANASGAPSGACLCNTGFTIDSSSSSCASADGSGNNGNGGNGGNGGSGGNGNGAGGGCSGSGGAPAPASASVMFLALAVLLGARSRAGARRRSAR